MKNKILLLIVFLFSLIFVNSISAYLLSYAAWDDNQNIKTINFGEEAGFFINSRTDNPPIYIDVNIYDSRNNIVSHYFSDIANVDEYDRDFMITSNDYRNIGSYRVNIEIQNDDEDEQADIFNLILNVESQINHAPTINLISPENNAQDISLNPTLVWEGNDEDNDELTYDVYLNNALVLDDTEVLQYQLRNLNYDTEYNWQVVVNDGVESIESDVWNFRTIREQRINNPPFIPSNPYPEHNAINVQTELTLRWNGGDPDGDLVRYTIFLNGRVVCRNILLTSCYVDLEYNTHYNWQVIANDGELTTRGPIWRFTTFGFTPENQAPIINIIKPSEGSVVFNIYNIEWNSYDIDGEIINTKIYYKKNNVIPLIGGLFDLFNKYKLLVEIPNNPEEYNWDTTQFRNGVYSLKIIVIDNDNAKGEDVVEIFNIMNIVLPENRAPEIISEPVTKIIVNTNYIYDVDAVDADADEIIYSLRNAPEGMRINSDTGIINWLPKKTGVYDVTVIARDEHGAFDSQVFNINVLPEEIISKKQKEVHEFSISNVILHQDGEYVNIYVHVMNKGNQDEKIQLRAINMNTGDVAFDSFNLGKQDNYWRILKLSKPANGIYTIGVWGNSKDYKDIVYRDIIIV